MKSGYLIHILAAFTLLFGVWIFLDKPQQKSNDAGSTRQNVATLDDARRESTAIAQNQAPLPLFNVPGQIPAGGDNTVDSGGDAQGRTAAVTQLNPEELISNYVLAWRNKDTTQINKTWSLITECEACLTRLVDMIVNKSLEEGMMLEIAIKMAALDNNSVMPVFDALIDPAGNPSAAIILSEKIVNNGRPEFVTKIFDIIYNAQQNGYDHFARQLTWVISKLENQEGIKPILDTITGRASSSPEFSDHVSNVFSKVVFNLPGSEGAAQVMADYYIDANSQEQQRLWKVMSKHGDTLVKLAAYADQNGQNYDVQKYATAIAELPNLQAVDGLVKLHMAVEYQPDYLAGMLKENVVKNPTYKVLQKLEDFMRDPDVSLDTRLFAAEGLLAVKDNRLARYILEKVVRNPQYANPDLQAYIGGRL